MVFDPEKARKDFPMLQDASFVYLDTAATAHKPQCVIDRISRFYAKEYATVNRAVYEQSKKVTEEYMQAREVIRDFIGAKHAEEIVFTRGTTESINIIANCYALDHLQKGDKILITEMEHHANIIPWQMVAKKTGAELIYVQMTSLGELDLEDFAQKIALQPKIFAVTHMSNVFGTINPLQMLIQKAHEMGAVVVVDGAQAITHLDVDVQKLDADFYAFSGHKLYGPTGIGVLYGKEHLLGKMSPWLGGGDMVDQVNMHTATFQKAPFKFEGGTPQIAEVLGLKEAIAYFTQYSIKDLQKHENALLRAFKDKLLKRSDVRLLGNPQNQSSLMSFVFSDMHSLDFGTLISLHNVCLRTGTMCAIPALAKFGVQNCIRVSFGLYNTFCDVELFFHSVSRVEDLLLNKS